MACASAADTFVLGPPAIGGSYLYRLFHNGITDPADGDWYMRMTLAPTVPVYEHYPIVLLGLTELPTLQRLFRAVQERDVEKGAAQEPLDLREEAPAPIEAGWRIMTRLTS
ncbi:hypothetical protein [Aminobacter sp. LjRoot7]|uniref:hypothetical protein n=1 Tax=Aminobacter sp. LjRoot7 TaxID=3342335 RepID=UPI003ECC1E31